MIKYQIARSKLKSTDNHSRLLQILKMCNIQDENYRLGLTREWRAMKYISKWLKIPLNNVKLSTFKQDLNGIDIIATKDDKIITFQVSSFGAKVIDSKANYQVNVANKIYIYKNNV